MGTLIDAGYSVSAEDVVWIRLDDQSAVGTARRTAVRLANALGFTEGRAGEVAIAVSEAAANLHRHATDGTLLLRVVRIDSHAGVEFVAVDHGPGMASVAWSEVDGNSSSGTLGIGLGAISRLASDSDLFTLLGLGTVLTATFWAGQSPWEPPVDVGGITRPITGEPACGDAWGVHVTADAISAVLCDGLGHGPLAARASSAALAVFRSQPMRPPAELLTAMHAPLSHTRGVAAAAVQIRRQEQRVLFAGVGNISAWLLSGDQRHGMLSQPGILGHRARPVRTVEMDSSPGALLVLHSDGVRDHWDLGAYPGLRQRRALAVAATLLRVAGGRRDDASVLVARLP